MPKLTDPKVVTYIVDELIENPSISYPVMVSDIQATFGVKLSIEGVKQIAIRECPKIVPAWEKVNPLIGEYFCQFRLPSGRRHLKKFRGQVGYSGDHARFCADHRTGKFAKRGQH